MTRRRKSSPLTPLGPFGKLVALVLGGVLLVAGFMFSVVVLAVVAVLVIIAWGFFWWKTRAFRAAVREAAGANPASGQPESYYGTIIDGEAQVVEAVIVDASTGDNPDADRKSPS